MHISESGIHNDPYKTNPPTIDSDEWLMFWRRYLSSIQSSWACFSEVYPSWWGTMRKDMYLRNAKRPLLICKTCKEGVGPNSEGAILGVQHTVDCTNNHWLAWKGRENLVRQCGVRKSSRWGVRIDEETSNPTKRIWRLLLVGRFKNNEYGETDSMMSKHSLGLIQTSWRISEVWRWNRQTCRASTTRRWDWITPPLDYEPSKHRNNKMHTCASIQWCHAQ